MVLMVFAVVREFQDTDPPPASQPLPSDTPLPRRCETPRPTLSPSATPAATPRGIARGWRVRTFPSPDIHEFRDIATAQDGSVWVVGSRRTAGPPVVCGLSTLTSHPVVRRWDGRAWHELPALPKLGDLETVAVAGETAWVFGRCRDAADPDTNAPCYARWTGAGWQGGTFESDVSISDAVALDDGQVWAIPQSAHNEKGQVFHWDGQSWREMALPFDDARSSQTPYVDARLLPQPGNEFSHKVMRRLDQNLAARYDLAALSDTFKVSTRTLLRRFADETGQSPLEYLQSSRVRRARHLLETTNRTVASISAAVGYRDPSTFAALFAKHTGRRPRDHRAAFRRVD